MSTKNYSHSKYLRSVQKQIDRRRMINEYWKEQASHDECLEPVQAPDDERIRLAQVMSDGERVTSTQTVCNRVIDEIISEATPYVTNPTRRIPYDLRWQIRRHVDDLPLRIALLCER